MFLGAELVPSLMQILWFYQSRREGWRYFRKDGTNSARQWHWRGSPVPSQTGPQVSLKPTPNQGQVLMKSSTIQFHTEASTHPAPQTRDVECCNLLDYFQNGKKHSSNVVSPAGKAKSNKTRGPFLSLQSFPNIIGLEYPTSIWAKKRNFPPT